MKKTLNKKNTLICLAVIMVVTILCAIFINPFEKATDLYYLTNYFKAFVTMAVLVELVLFYYLSTCKKIKYEIVFPLLLLAFGLIYLFAITPLSCPDESHHYQSAYCLANMILGKEPIMGNAADFDYSSYVLHENVASGYLRIIKDFFASKVVSEAIEIPGPRSVGYIMQHLPQALGIIIARGLRLNSLHIYQAGRLANLILSVVCLHFAIKCTPKFKLLFGMVFLMPMAVQQASAYTYDCYVNAMTILSIGLLLKAIWGEGKLKLSYLILMFVVNLLQAPAKTGYAFVALLVFFIPSNRFAKPWMKWVYCSIYALACLGFSLKLYRTPSKYGKSGEYAVAYTSAKPMYSFGWIAANPLEAIKVYLNTLIKKGPWYIGSCIGYSLSGLSLHIPAVIVIGFGLLSLLSLFVENKEDKNVKITKGLRAMMLFIVFLISFLILTIMFISWTYNDSPVIEGVQGRYFLPIVTLLFMAISKKKTFIKENWNKIFIMSASLLQLATIIVIFVKTIY